MPPGVIVHYALDQPTPAGWRRCDGSSLNASEYPRLATAIREVFGKKGRREEERERGEG